MGEVTLLAEGFNWKVLDYQNNIKMISFKKIIDGYRARINVYLTKMTVATCIDHPYRGKTQLFRKKVSEELLGHIFENPRIHTGKGYRKLG